MHANFQKQWKSLMAALLSCLLGLVSASGCARDDGEAQQQALIERGHKIFLGEEAIDAKIAGHKDPLPPQVAKCINCHTPTPRPRQDDQFAPILNRAGLIQAHARRGGPAFAYTRESLCKTMRTGIDPAYIVLNRSMPRFDISDEQCHSLWAFFTAPGIDEKK